MTRIHHDLGHGSTLTGYTDQADGINHAIEQGSVFCMPLRSNIVDMSDRATLVKCPVCLTECWRDQRIPAGAIAACTSCALKIGAGRI